MNKIKGRKMCFNVPFFDLKLLPNWYMFEYDCVTPLPKQIMVYLKRIVYFLSSQLFYWLSQTFWNEMVPKSASSCLFNYYFNLKMLLEFSGVFLSWFSTGFVARQERKNHIFVVQDIRDIFFWFWFCKLKQNAWSNFERLF